MRTRLFLIFLFLVSQSVVAQSDCDKQGDELLARIDSRAVAEEASAEQLQELNQMKQMLKMQLPVFCQTGMDTSLMAAGIDESLDKMFPPRTVEERAQDRAVAGLSKGDLTDEYLKGRWCTRPGDNFRGEGYTYEFSADGSYKSGHPNKFYLDKPEMANMTDLRLAKGSKSDFLSSFARLRSLEQSRFSIQSGGRKSTDIRTFNKGACPYLDDGN